MMMLLLILQMLLLVGWVGSRGGEGIDEIGWDFQGVVRF